MDFDRAGVAMTEESMAMVLEERGKPLVARSRPVPTPVSGQVLIEVNACGVCRTDRHLIDGELPGIQYPIVPGHQVVGRIAKLGAGVDNLHRGQRVGVTWLGSSCGSCDYCRRGDENLCDSARFTGFQNDGGYATHCIADARYVFPLPEHYSDLSIAPLLCAGLIGYRCLRFCGDQAKQIGFYGFGAAAHLIAQVALWQDRRVMAFTRPGDIEGQRFAKSIGAHWCGGSDEHPPNLLDAAIIFASAGELIPLALHAVRKGGTVICGGIHMSDIPSFPYSVLWGERHLRSVANLTRHDATEFLDLAPRVPVQSQVTTYPLEEANRALDDLRDGRFVGAAVLTIR